MCGISGVRVVGASRLVNARTRAEAMSDRLRHRGPDASGLWEGDGIALAHRRLAVVDLSEAGAQPMLSGDERWVLAYNGELYNTDRLRADLGGSVRLRGHSDTEVLIETIARIGPHGAAQRCIGMFAFAAWDRHERTLWLARDRFGEKPLVYGHADGVFAFASELGALEAAMSTRPEISQPAVANLLARGAIPAPLTIYEGVAQLPPGHVLRVDGDGLGKATQYWDPAAVVADRNQPIRRGSDAVDELDEMLGRVVQSRTVSDVPLGAFLSGGIDSTLIVAMMQRHGGDTRTFTVGFEDIDLDESSVARRTSAVLGTQHEELRITGAEALAIVPRLARIYDQPFADSSQIPTYLISEFTRRHVTVALSGDGGDEVFGGYERYAYFERLSSLLRAPRSVRHSLARIATAVPPTIWERVARSPGRRLLPTSLRRRTASKASKLAEMIRANDGAELYQSLLISNHGYADLMLSPADLAHPSLTSDLSDIEPRELAMVLDTLDYLPTDILTKVDRAAMSVSLETRVPFLDPDLFGFAWNLHPDDRARDGHGKWILRELLARHVPREIVELPKRGFGVPLDAWLRGPLRVWADELLDPQLVVEHGLLRADAVRSTWQRHLDRDADLSPELWPILMLQAWQADR